MAFGDKEKQEKIRKARQNGNTEISTVNLQVPIIEKEPLDELTVASISMKKSTKKKLQQLKKHYNKTSEAALVSELIEKLYENTDF